ncbi:uncharacterized protein LOC108843955 isoform X2 [Raphanus sativus]|uniref:Uncharacterized protein LOC108843955 isoform X2 n=1 Tax=Raphanus sativus TaxID=3726 RepID=A0A6J0ML33_RAPSA|nr:uncharacterized protein LOC108843955 isoform X2 [Raphanus sativus]
MESKEIRSSVFAKTTRFNGISQQPLRQEKSRAFDSGFKVVPTKELCRVYLNKKELLASKGIIDARAKPPHYQKHGEKPKQRTFGRRFDQQNLNLKPKKDKKESCPRRFSPLGFGSDSQLRDSSRKKGQCIITPEKKKPKEMSNGTTTTLVEKKDGAVREAGSKLIVSTSRDSVLSLERNRFAQDVKFRHVSSSSSGSIIKDENEDSSDCSSTASPGCQTEEAHQPSPVSVLEPIFNDDVLEEDSEELPYLDLHEKQLDDLKTESDSYSDGSGMEVSSDDDSVMASETEESKESEPVWLLDSQEIKESSYIDDILSEVSLMDKNWVPDTLTFKVFEKMEKKYYTETSWKRSERRVLFDRVCSGLVEILESFTATPTLKKPVSRRLGAGLSTCGLKQELCKVLARQENRAKKVSSNKVPVIDLDEWFKLEDDDDEALVCELEGMIVDDLLLEVVSFIM